MSKITSGQPPLADLMGRYLNRQGRTAGAVSPGSEVVLFDAGPVQPVDPLPAWEAAVEAVPFFLKEKTASWQAPPFWPELVAAQEPAVALAFCTGNYPQLMRHLYPLLHQGNLSRLRPQGGQPLNIPGLSEWVRDGKDFSHSLLAVASLRLARQFPEAEDLIRGREKSIPASLSDAWANEAAALAWHGGRHDQAIRMWKKQPASVPVLFNRGMAALFSGQPSEARNCLSEAVAKLAEVDGWHHLGRLYLALAESR